MDSIKEILPNASEFVQNVFAELVPYVEDFKTDGAKHTNLAFLQAKEDSGEPDKVLFEVNNAQVVMPFGKAFYDVVEEHDLQPNQVAAELVHRLLAELDKS